MPGVRITIDVFSGRPNPVVELDGADAKDALARMTPVRKLAKGDAAPPPVPTLGYRGLVVESLGGKPADLPESFRYFRGSLAGPGLAHRADDTEFEDFVCGSTGVKKLGLPPTFPDQLRKEMVRADAIATVKWPTKIVFPLPPKCPCAPLYEPAWWNDAGTKQFGNNCYNYATNYRTDTFAQPGRAAGAMYGALTCAAVKPAAVADCLIDSPKAENKCPPEGHLVALVVAPGWDFHWYRKGRNGYWSHKPGGTPVTNVDNAGVSISDPRTANRGPYTAFCTFMVVMHGHIKIK